MESTVAGTRPASGGRALLELDPELGQLLSADRREQAERELRVRVSTFGVGEWDGGRLANADPTHLGLLIAEGVLAREVVLGDTVSTELLGPGDIIRPWHLEGPPELLPVTVRWNALSGVRLGLIDRRVAVALGRFPEVSAGIAVPLVLSHRLIGELIGARRPTVSTALAELARDGQLVRRDDGTWLLTGEPIAVPGASAAEVIRQRRRLMPTPQEPAVDEVRAPDDRMSEMQASLS